MSDLYNSSVPFTLEDLGMAGKGTEGPQFVDLFSRTEPEAVEEAALEPEPEAAEPETTNAPPAAKPSLEDQTRKTFEDAYAQGEKAGYEMGLRRVESIARRLEKQIEEVASFRHELGRRFERLATDLALVFAEALVLRECSEKRDLVAGMIRKALEACEDKNELFVRMRSEDMKYVEGVASDRIKIVADDTLNEPGFVIETSMGDIDGRISVQIDELKNALAGYHGT